MFIVEIVILFSRFFNEYNIQKDNLRLNVYLLNTSHFWTYWPQTLKHYYHTIYIYTYI